MRGRYVTTRRLAELDQTLSQRDGAILRTLARVRVASGAQLARLHVGDVSPRQTRAVLASLVDRQVLARLPRVVGGVRAGSAGFVYVLGVAGQRLTRPRGSRPQRPWKVGTAFLAHSLAISELYVRLIEAQRARRLRLIGFTTEPACWRGFTGPGGGRAMLKPDAAISVELGEYWDSWFIEVDRGTESTTTIARKCEVYRHYWQTGTEQAHGGVFPRVLWLVPDLHRYEQLVDVLGRQPAEAWPLFSVAMSGDVIDRVTQGADA